VPGKSGWEELTEVFERAGYTTAHFPSSQDLTRFGFYLPVMPNTNPQPFSFDVLEQHGMVEGIDVSFTIHEPVSSPISFPALDEAARQYSIDAIVGRLGPPAQVLVHAPNERAEPGGGWTYGLWLYYAHEGLAVSYEGQGLSRQGDLVRVCPSFEAVQSIRLYLRDAEWRLTLEEITEGQALIEEQTRSRELVPVEVATGLALGDFYRAFSEPGAEPCLLMPPTEG
jgi:hypothetical protein